LKFGQESRIYYLTGVWSFLFNPGPEILSYSSADHCLDDLSYTDDQKGMYFTEKYTHKAYGITP